MVSAVKIYLKKTHKQINKHLMSNNLFKDRKDQKRQKN